MRLWFGRWRSRGDDCHRVDYPAGFILAEVKIAVVFYEEHQLIGPLRYDRRFRREDFILVCSLYRKVFISEILRDRRKREELAHFRGHDLHHLNIFDKRRLQHLAL